MGLLLVVKVVSEVGAVIETDGAVASYVTVSVAVLAFPAASRAVTVSTLVPGCSVIPEADHVVVPAAVPLPPTLLVHETCVTPILSAAVPPRLRGVAFVVNVAPVVGAV